MQQARAELDGIAARLHREDPTSDVGYGVYLRTFNDAFTGDVRPALLMLMEILAAAACGMQLAATMRRLSLALQLAGER